LEGDVGLKYEVRKDWHKKSRLYEISKRLLDIIGASLGIIVFTPLMTIASIAIKLDSKGPVLFAQRRCGRGGKVFKMYKFRSMVNNAEDMREELESKNEVSGPVFKIRKDPRVTRVGRIIRKTSIDELPQFINVLKGEMSLVGPRPPIDKEVESYTLYQKQRMLIKPGLTCIWQVSGRNSIDFERWVELDLKYIRERNFWLDVKLILKTFSVLLGDENAC
jgi:lipopolysaccharide/colanic/teichoic acid biosynthesis glycosyltransferase